MRKARLSSNATRVLFLVANMVTSYWTLTMDLDSLGRLTEASSEERDYKDETIVIVMPMSYHSIRDCPGEHMQLAEFPSLSIPIKGQAAEPIHIPCGRSAPYRDT